MYARRIQGGGGISFRRILVRIRLDYTAKLSVRFSDSTVPRIAYTQKPPCTSAAVLVGYNGKYNIRPI